MGFRHLILAASAVLVGQASANDVVETASQYYAAYELGQGGEAFYSRFLEFGWPTDTAHQELTTRYAGAPSEQVLASLLASGTGLPLSSTRQIKGENGKGTQKIAAILAGYRTQAGFSAALPAAFEPTCMPSLRSRQQLVRAYRPNDLGTWKWVSPPSQQYSLEGFGFSLLSEVAFARQELLKKDPTPENEFFANLAIHSALAKASELPHLIYDSRRQRISQLEGELLAIDEHHYYFANSWLSEPDSRGLLEHTLAAGDSHRRSYLRSQSALLLGLCNLVSLANPQLRDRPKLLTSRHHEQLLELTLLAFKMLRAQHIDVRAGRARSGSKSSVAAPIDLGLCLLALEAFITHVQPDKTKARLNPTIEGERRKALTLVKFLGRQVQEWCDPGTGVFDSYDLSSNRRVARTKSVASQALAARGLLAAHRVTRRDNPDDPFMLAAHKVLEWLDEERWTSKGQLFVDEKLGKEVNLFGVASCLGLLREMALEYQDGHYLLRYRQLLEGAHRAGLFTEARDQQPAGLAPKLVLP